MSKGITQAQRDFIKSADTGFLYDLHYGILEDIKVPTELGAEMLTHKQAKEIISQIRELKKFVSQTGCARTDDLHGS